MSIAFDTSRFPIVTTRFPKRWSDEEMDAYFDAVREVHRREQRFVHIADISEASAMSTAAVRKRASDFMKAEHAHSIRLCAGSVFVAPSLLLRGVITALNWANPPAFPYAIFSTMAQAADWAESRYAEDEASGV